MQRIPNVFVTLSLKEMFGILLLYVFEVICADFVYVGKGKQDKRRRKTGVLGAY